MHGPRHRRWGGEELGAYIVALEPGAEMPPEAGREALGLRRLVLSGLAVPPTWIVLPGANHEEIGRLIETVTAKGISLLAVRISAFGEDGAGRSFAGLRRSLLGIPPERLEAAIAKAVGPAPWDGARPCRTTQWSGGPSEPCAVVVQPLVGAEVAGVACGRRNGRREIVVEAAAGLGETGVGGRTEPEVLEVHPVGDTWQVLRRRPGRQTSALVVDGRSVVRREAPRRSFTASVLPDEVAVEIAAAVAELQWNLSRPLDVDWALENGRLWWLRMRLQSTA